jgi:hypothetical protein|tara:strand:+ start:791 stop:982 length:192 start_codon:yes stop_codon:yes gene_type:complete
MNLLTQAWNYGRTAACNVWGVVLDLGWSVWNEVQDGASRFSWWLLLGLVWLSGAIAHAWLWTV